MASGIAAQSERGTDMVKDDGGIRKRAGEIGHFANLGLEDPGVERQAEPTKLREAFAKDWVAVESGGCMGERPEHRRIGVVRTDVPDATETPVSGCDLRLEYHCDTVAAGQIGMTDDARASPQRAVDTAGALRRDAIDEFDLSDRFEVRRRIGAVERAALDEDRADNVVAAERVGAQLVEQIAR